MYEAPDKSTLPADVVADIDRICGDSKQCIFDMSLTRNADVGKFTMKAVYSNELAKMYTQPGEFCYSWSC